MSRESSDAASEDAGDAAAMDADGFAQMAATFGLRLSAKETRELFDGYRALRAMVNALPDLSVEPRP